jgi:CrcB protein
MMNAVAIAIGGSFGALARYYLSKIITDHYGTIFPWGTLLVNVTGSLCIGLFFGLFDKTVVPSEVKAFINIGFIGAFTTFSTFALESITLLRGGEIKMGLLNIGISNGAGILCVLIGLYLTGFITQK